MFTQRLKRKPVLSGIGHLDETIDTGVVAVDLEAEAAGEDVNAGIRDGCSERWDQWCGVDCSAESFGMLQDDEGANFVQRCARTTPGGGEGTKGEVPELIFEGHAASLGYIL
jgi:hypothetical protein